MGVRLCRHQPGCADRKRAHAERNRLRINPKLILLGILLMASMMQNHKHVGMSSLTHAEWTSMISNLSDSDFLPRLVTVISKLIHLNYSKTFVFSKFNPSQPKSIEVNRSQFEVNSAWAYSVHFLSLRVYQYGSRVRQNREMVVHPWFLGNRFEHECVYELHPLASFL